MRNHKKLLRWILINGAFLILAYYAYAADSSYTEPIRNIFVFALWFLFIAAIITLGASLLIATKPIEMERNFKELGGAGMGEESYIAFKQKYSPNFNLAKTNLTLPVPQWVDIIYDISIICLLAGSSHFILGSIYIATMIINRIAKILMVEQQSCIKNMVGGIEDLTMGPVVTNTEVLDL